MKKYSIINKCQISNDKKLKKIISLGYIPPVNSMINQKKGDSTESFFAPLELYYSEKSKLVQLSAILNQNILFPVSYPYTSSTTKILRENFKELREEVDKKFNFKKNSLIIDIGSNDGNLLSKFKDKYNVLGITPENIGKLAIKKGIPTIIDYFNKKNSIKILKKYGKAKIITATNVFAHIENINQIMIDIKRCLSQDGVFITESHYLLTLLKTVQYDTIYHEHLRYYSLRSLKYLFEKHNLEIFHAKKIPTHGGSIRVYCSKPGKNKISSSVYKILNEEKKINWNLFNDFKQKTINSKLDLISLIKQIKKNKNIKIAGISAPSRSSTLINFVGLDENIIECIFEVKGSKKIGKFVPGTKIPVVEEKIKLLKRYNYLIIFSWHIYRDLLKILKKKGFKGKFIIPLPKPRIV